MYLPVSTALFNTFAARFMKLTVSAIVPICRSALTVAVNVPVSSIPSRFRGANPVSVKVTVYVPGRKSTMRN